MQSQCLTVTDVTEAIRRQLDGSHFMVMLYRGDEAAVRVVLTGMEDSMVQLNYRGDHMQLPADKCVLLKNGLVWHIVIPECVQPVMSYFRRADVQEPAKVYGSIKALQPAGKPKDRPLKKKQTQESVFVYTVPPKSLLKKATK
jgi:hypothetical protein